MPPLLLYLVAFSFKNDDIKITESEMLRSCMFLSIYYVQVRPNLRIHNESHGWHVLEQEVSIHVIF